MDRFSRSDIVDKSEFDFGEIAKRSGALFINPDTPDTHPICKRAIRKHKIDGFPIVFCSAAVLDSGTVVTARHCLMKGSVWQDAKYCLRSGAVEFRTFDSPDISYQLLLTKEEEQELNNRTSVSDDYAILETSTQIAGISSPTETERAEKYAPAMIVGYHDLVVAEPRVGKPNWLGKVRWSRPHCSFIRSNGACGVTKCQTISGFSGVPVWSLNDSGETKLSAIQVEGGSGSYSHCLGNEGLDNVGSQGNLAIASFFDGG